MIFARGMMRRGIVCYAFRQAVEAVKSAEDEGEVAGEGMPASGGAANRPTSELEKGDCEVTRRECTRRADVTLRTSSF